MSVLRAINVNKSFGAVSVLHGVNLDVSDGEFIVLVGPSGCGKSTLLAIIAGLEHSSSGDIVIGDVVVNDVHPKDRNIAMVFQNYALYPTMSVRDNLTFGLQARKVPKAEHAAIVDRVAKFLQIEPLLERRPSQLSGGQRQRVAMGRALVRNPDLFLFDEPLSNLDAKLRAEMRSRDQAPSSNPGHDHGLCDARSSRSDDACHEDCRDGWWHHSAIRRASGRLRATSKHLCGDLHGYSTHRISSQPA